MFFCRRQRLQTLGFESLFLVSVLFNIALNCQVTALICVRIWRTGVILQEKTKILEKNLTQCYFVHHRSDMAALESNRSIYCLKCGPTTSKVEFRFEGTVVEIAICGHATGICIAYRFQLIRKQSMLYVRNNTLYGDIIVRICTGTRFQKKGAS